MLAIYKLNSWQFLETLKIKESLSFVILGMKLRLPSGEQNMDRLRAVGFVKLAV